MERIEGVDYSSRFLKKMSRLPARLVDVAQRKERLFKEEPFAPRLETHKLHGKDKDSWAFSIDRKYRIKFIFVGENKVLFLDVGTHDMYA